MRALRITFTVGSAPLKCPLRRANPWVQDLCKHPSFPQTVHKQKRCFLHAKQRTHFTITPFIVNINLLLYIHPHIGGHMGLRAIRMVSNLMPNIKLRQVQQGSNILNSRGHSICA